MNRVYAAETAVCCLLQERFYFGDTVLPLFESGIPLVRERLKRLQDADNITIAYPDEGAWKRFHYQFGDYPEVGRAGSFLARQQLRVCCGLTSASTFAPWVAVMPV